MSLDGPISARLRVLYGPSVADWPAYRKRNTLDTPLSAEDYTGWQMSEPSDSRYWKEPEQ